MYSPTIPCTVIFGLVKYSGLACAFVHLMIREVTEEKSWKDTITVHGQQVFQCVRRSVSKRLCSFHVHVYTSNSVSSLNVSVTFVHVLSFNDHFILSSFIYFCVSIYKTWETLNEILSNSKKSESVEKISVNGNTTSDPCEIANSF